MASKPQHEQRVFWLTLVGGLPAVALGIVLLWTGGFAPRVQWTLGGIVVLAWIVCALMVRERVIRPLQTVSNVLAALRERDYTLRARGSNPEDALGLLLLELNSARVSLLRSEVALRSARLELGRRIGRRGPVDAVALDTLPVPDLPLSLPQLMSLALEAGPEYRVARANERQAEAVVRGRRGNFLPTLAISGNIAAFDENWFPNALTRRTGVVRVEEKVLVSRMSAPAMA